MLLKNEISSTTDEDGADQAQDKTEHVGLSPLTRPSPLRRAAA